MNENKETVLQLGANVRISRLWPDLSPSHETTLENLRLRSYILFYTFRCKTIYFSLVPRYCRLSL